MTTLLTGGPDRAHLADVPEPPSRARREHRPSVCLYTPSYDPSGMGVHMLALAEEYVGAGVDVTVMYWPAPRAEALLGRARELGATPVRTPHPRDPSYGDEVTAALRDLAPDVFHVHVGTGREDFGGARAARAAGVPVVVETLHLPWAMRNRRKRASFFRSIEAVDALITVSEAQRTTYERIGVPPELITTVANGVVLRGAVPSRAEARRRLGLDPQARVVMTVGRLVTMKGQLHLVDAVPALRRRVPDVQVVVVGDGHLRPALERRVGDLGVEEAVHLVGHRDDARELLQAADVFVLPSLREGMPLGLLEAMEAGLPAVATRVVGTTEVVEDGVTGLLVPPADPVALGAALAALLEDDVGRARMAAAARRRFHHRYTAAHMAADTMAVCAAAGRAVRPVHPASDLRQAAGALG